MQKNIVVLSDGTGQEGGKGHDTNVYKLFRMLEDRTEHQVVFYDEGIGTETNKVTGSIAGAGFSDNIKQCYHFIFDNYNAGDQIYLFGFSRGAATVRSLANFIDYFGILPKSRPELIEQAYRIYRKGPQVRDGEALDFVQKHPNHWVMIEFLGVWDTVPALGLPGNVLDLFIDVVPSWRHQFHDFKLHPSVANAYHALSIDDDRKWFLPTIWDSLHMKEQNVEQVWFAGAHSDVGGGVRENPGGLSDIALEWMLQKAIAHGIRLYLNSRKNWNFVVAPDYTDQWHPPRTGITKVIYPEGQRFWPEKAMETFGKPKVHESVFKREAFFADSDEKYEPWILKDFPDAEHEPWEELFVKDDDGESKSIRDYDQSTWQDKFKFDGQAIKVDENPILKNLKKRATMNDNRILRDLKRWSSMK